MASSLLDSLRSLVTPDLLSRAASQLGEPESVTARGLQAAFPAILAALVNRAGEPSFLQRLLSMFQSSALDTGALSNPANLLGALQPGSSSPLAQVSSQLLSLAFGGQTNRAADVIADASGARPASAGSLLTLAAPLVLGTLARRVRSEGLDAGGLANLLLGQKNAILDAAPPGIAALLGDGTRRVAAAVPSAQQAAAGSSRWIWGLALLLGLFALWALLRSREAERPVASVPTPPPVAAAPPAAADLVRRTLPGGGNISFPRGSLEDALVVLIEDTGKPLDQGSWIDFDRLLFDTGSATLQPRSREQLRNVAAILAAYPSTRVKIGGYTDNVGDDAANLDLSRARAESVRSELVALGVPAERLQAEGYGEQHPVASNDTETGRSQNRRISLLVLER
jgi:outer membrane protein OmpA-like peptidoglycan-associated protein